MTSGAGRVAWAVLILTGDTIRRLLREGLVVRSLVWPGLLAAASLAAVLGVLAMVRSEPRIAVAPGTPPAVVAALSAAGLTVEEDPNPRAAVVGGQAPIGTDGHVVWSRGGAHTLQAEIAVRNAVGAPWTPVAPILGPAGAPPVASDVPKLPEDAVGRVLAMLFMLYGLVFGLGGVARDRDQGILDAELCLPIPRWATGFARWLGSTVVLTGFLALSVLLVNAVLPLGDPTPALVHGFAALATSVAIGMAVVGHAGLKQGFSGPFGVGMTLTTGAASLGLRYDLPWVPVASLFSTKDGTVAALLAGVVGVLGSWVYARRTGGPP